MFSTKRYDQQTGLYDYGFRRYVPAIGRWTTRDPLGEAGGLNLYAFVGNNPVNWVDPWGLQSAAGAAAGTLVCGPPCTVAGALIGLGIGIGIGYLVIDAIHTVECEDTQDYSDVQNPDPDPCKGLRYQLQEHIKKLAEYMTDPYVHDNQGFLANSPSERHPQIIEGRIRNLRRQIENFRRLLEECERLHGM